MVPDVVFFHKDYRKVVEEIRSEQSIWRLVICLVFLSLGGLFVYRGGKDFTPLIGIGILCFVLLGIRIQADLSSGNDYFDGRDVLPWFWGVIPPDHNRFLVIKHQIQLALLALSPDISYQRLEWDYEKGKSQICSVLTDWTEEIIRLERAGVGQESVCVERRERFRAVIEGLAAQGEGCLLPLGIKNPRRYYYQAAEERLAKK